MWLFYSFVIPLYNLYTRIQDGEKHKILSSFLSVFSGTPQPAPERLEMQDKKGTRLRAAPRQDKKTGSSGAAGFVLSDLFRGDYCVCLAAFLAAFLASQRVTHREQEMSPVTLRQVRPMSKSRSTATMRPM